VAVNANAEYFAGLQLATDGRIYVARSPYGFDELGVIYNPKRPGTECNFNYLDGNSSGFSLGGARSKYGFPVYMQSYFDVPHFNAEMICFSDTTVLKLTNYANVQSVIWDFGDPGSSSNTSTSLQPTHIFSTPGEFTVAVTENGSYTYTERVVISELPDPQLPDTAYMYRGSSILLNAEDGYQSYEWSTGENTSSIKVNETGDYWVIVQNEKCCYNLDSVTVLFYDIIVPNAFRPGGVNNIFRAIPSSDEAISNFTMYIYSRWGQQVFESDDIGKGWDGTVTGQPAPGGAYIWIIYYDVEKEGRQERIANKGSLFLLR
jgi:gliding motility-associated-like protein